MGAVVGTSVDIIDCCSSALDEVNYYTRQSVEMSSYLSGTASKFFIVLICWKWFDISVANTSSITSERNSLQPHFIMFKII